MQSSESPSLGKAACAGPLRALLWTWDLLPVLSAGKHLANRLVPGEHLEGLGLGCCKAASWQVADRHQRPEHHQVKSAILFHSGRGRFRSPSRNYVSQNGGSRGRRGGRRRSELFRGLQELDLPEILVHARAVEPWGNPRSALDFTPPPPWRSRGRRSSG